MDRRASLTVGVDLGDRYSELCYLSDAGEVLDRARVRTRPGAFLDALAGYRARVVLEAGTHSRWVSSVVEELGHEVIVANPRRVELISNSQRKSDVTDAELLARLGRADPALLSPIQHRAETTQVDLAVVRARAAVVRSRTLLVNHCRGIVKAAGEDVSKVPDFPAGTSVGVAINGSGNSVGMSFYGSLDEFVSLGMKAFSRGAAADRDPFDAPELKEEAAPEKEEAAPEKEEAAPEKEEAAPEKEEAAPEKTEKAAEPAPKAE